MFFGIGYAVPHWGQLMAGVSDEAFDQYLGSKGQRADIALQEDGRPVHSERADPTRQLGPEYSPGELQALKTGDASLYIAEQHAASPEGQRQAAVLDNAQREQEPESWRQYQQCKDAEVETLVRANAAKDERLRLFNEALTPDPDLLPQVFHLPFVREELNAVHAQRQLERNHAAYQQAALAHESPHPGYIAEIYAPYQQSVRREIAAARKAVAGARNGTDKAMIA